VSEAEFAKIMFHIRELPIRTIVETAYRLGWRYAELLSLRVRHRDVKNRILRLDAGSTKNSDSRAVPVEPDLFNLLMACAGNRKAQDWLFVRGNGSRVREMRHVWQRACVAAGLAHWVHKPCYRAAVREHGEKNVDPKDFVPDTLHRCPACEGRVYHNALKYCGVIFHDTRRASATNMIRRGVPALTAMRFTGHRTLKMFTRYRICEMEELQAASRKMEEARQLELAELARKEGLSLRYAEVEAGKSLSGTSGKVQ
jgi:integrase